MFAKYARWHFPGQDVQAIVNHVCGALYHAGISVAPVGAMRWEGMGPAGSYGLSPKVMITATPDQGGFWLNLNLSAELEVPFIVLLGAGWLFCFPAAILVLVLGNSSWEKRAHELLATMQQPVAHLMAAPTWAQAPPPGSRP